LWKQFKEKVASGKDAGKIMDELGLDRYCCRAMFLGQEDYIDLVNKFKKF